MEKNIFENISPKNEQIPAKKQSSQKGMTRRDLLIGAGASLATLAVGKKIINIAEDMHNDALLDKKLQEIEKHIAERDLSKTTHEQSQITYKEKEIIGKTFIEQIRTSDTVILDNATRKAIYTHWHEEYTNHDKKLRDGLNRMQPWIAEIKEVFRTYDIPEEFIYLAIAESHFDIKAVSSKGAIGPYQITEKTARLPQYNLTVNSWCDERLDPIKSAELCAKHLRDSYVQFGNDWNMALMDYNGKLTNIYRKHLLKKEETVQIRVRPTKHSMQKGETLSSIAKQYNTSVKLLKRANKLSDNMVRTLQIGQKLYIPQEREEITFEKFNTWLEEQINKAIAEEEKQPDYTVKEKDTLSKIASQTNTTIKKLKEINHLTSDVIHPGMNLIIPKQVEKKRDAILKTLTNFKENINYPGKFYAIRDVIFEKKLDNTMRMQEKTYKYIDIPKINSTHLEYTIQKNDGIDKIAQTLHKQLTRSYKSFKQSVTYIKKEIIQQNNITNPNKIISGKKITIDIPIQQPTTLLHIAKKYNINITRLHKLNPAIRSLNAPISHNTKIRIPK
ncbi:MAG: hypothetical protein CR972_04260 [Candidatus Moraniibacteriota bacterium]|nr:MAG: hypothetical protein CR972_04260 [Candidatus Moranbacteria bacterium]